MNILEDDQLKLRAPEPSDLDLLYIWENDTSLWDKSATITPFSKHILEKYIQTAHLDLFEAQQLRLMIDHKTENRTIGTIDLFEYDQFNNRAGVGILIANISDRNKGYATLALKLVINYSFTILGLKQLYCNIDVENSSSLKLFQSCGFEIVGTKKAWTRRGNKWLDDYFLQIINI